MGEHHIRKEMKKTPVRGGKKKKRKKARNPKRGSLRTS